VRCFVVVVVAVVAVVIVSGVRKTFGLEKESATNNTSRLWLHLQIVTAVDFHSVYVRRTHCYVRDCLAVVDNR